MTADTLTLALWQTPHPTEPAIALERLETAAALASAGGAQWLVTPEMFLSGYLIEPKILNERAQTATASLALANIASRHRIGIVAGFPERNGSDLPFNAAIAVAPSGETIATYRKAHRYGPADRLRFTPGDRRPTVFEWNGWRLGMLICYDMEFPEMVRALALAGADAVLVPTANMEPFDEVQRVLLPARALENRLYMAYANACGREGDTVYNGLSTVCGPMGEVAAQAAREESLLNVTLTRAALDAARASSQLIDRRPDLYGPIVG